MSSTRSDARVPLRGGRAELIQVQGSCVPAISCGVGAGASSIITRPYVGRQDAEGTYAVFTSAVTETASADYEPEQIEAWLSARPADSYQWNARRAAAHTWVATADDRVVGFVDFLDDGLLDMLFVHPDSVAEGSRNCWSARSSAKQCSPGSRLCVLAPAGRPDRRSSASGFGSSPFDRTTGSASRSCPTTRWSASCSSAVVGT